VSVCCKELGSARGYLLLPGVSGGVGGGEVTGVSQVGFARGQVRFVTITKIRNGSAFHHIKKLIAHEVCDTIGLGDKADLGTPLLQNALQGLGRSI
jgi:hypothetical protein